MAKRRSKQRVMVDANILFAAVGWKRWPYYVLKHAAAGDYQLVLSTRIIDEAAEEIAAKLADQSVVFRRLLAVLKPEIAPEPTEKQIARNQGLLPDPEDVPIALAAINARVDYFVVKTNISRRSPSRLRHCISDSTSCFLVPSCVKS